MRERERKVKVYESEYSYHGKFQLPKRRRTLTSDVLHQKVKQYSQRELQSEERERVSAFETIIAQRTETRR
jgi:hypothetical protein